ncbi:hypothetical protein ACFL6H_06185 [Candidatus Latescibacterota bacterium]
MKKIPIYAIVICFIVISFINVNPLNAQDFSSNLFVSHKALGSIGLYSADGKHLKTIEVGPNPHEMVLSPDSKLIYVTDNGVMRWMDDADGGNTISIVDVASLEKVGEISTGKFRRPHGIDLDPATGLIAVTCEKPDRLLLIDPIAGKVLRDYPTGGTVSHNVILDNGAVWAYVTNITSNTVGAVNLYTGEVIQIPVGEEPQDGAFSKDGSELFVACADGVRIINVEQKKVIGKVGSGCVRIDITPDGKKLIAASRPAAVEFIEPANRRVLGKIELPGDPFSLSISRDGRFAFTGAEEVNEFYVISIASQKVIKSLKTIEGAHPDPVIDIPAR